MVVSGPGVLSEPPRERRFLPLVEVRREALLDGLLDAAVRLQIPQL